MCLKRNQLNILNTAEQIKMPESNTDVASVLMINNAKKEVSFSS